MFSSGKIMFAGGQSELKITVQPVGKTSSAGTATLSVSAASTGSAIKYKWVKYVGGVVQPIVIKEETK
jgi:hypothetical protein